MSSTSPVNSDCSETSSDSVDFDLSDFEFEFEDEDSTRLETTTTADQQIIDDVDEGAYQDEPIACDQWLQEYKQKEIEKKEQEEELTKRLNGSIPVNDW